MPTCTTVKASEDGTLVSEIKYTAFGEVRSLNGVLVTDNRYTGQREDSYINMYWYTSRWYDPALAHFNQPDTIVPYPNNAQDWDRYSYVINSPINYSDPSGHFLCNGLSGGIGFCGGGTSNPGYSTETMQEYGKVIKEYPWFHSKVSIHQFHEGKLAYNLFEKAPDLAQAHEQNQTDVWREARIFAEFTNQRLVVSSDFFIEPTTQNENDSFLAKIVNGVLGLGGLAGMVSGNKGQNPAEYWYNVTFGSPEEAMYYHYDQHPGPWNSAGQYTEQARNFFRKYSMNPNLVQVTTLRNGETGLYIRTKDYFGYFTFEGQIVSFGVRGK